MTIRTTTQRFTNLRNSVMPFVTALLGVLLMSAGVAQAQPEVAANVHFASGYVAATAPGAAARELAKGDDVYSGDRVDTADNGRVQMRFTDGGLLSLMPNTTFSVDEYLHEGKAEEDASLVFGLLKGGLRTVTGTIGQVQHDQYELKTPVATLGIRGTEYVAVLRPANTLRVHVGRGKVVITNDQGSLEVPEGRNAVVTLGSAPEFSEQGPQYQATGPMGDRLVATYQHHQDPHLLDPRANMPEFGTLVQTTPSTTPPVMIDLIAVAMPGGGVPVVLSPDDVVSSGWSSFDIGSSGALNWGAYHSGTGTVLGNPVTLGSQTSGAVMPYIVGASPVATLPSGMLNYSLDGATQAHDWSGNTGTLYTFDLGIDLGTLAYSLDFSLTMSNTGNYSGNTTGGTLSTALPQGFSFTDTVQNTSDCGSGCQLDVQGFMAGSNAEQAGVVYRILNQNSDAITGAAALSR